MMDSADPVTLEGSIGWTACRDQVCGFPEDYAFTLHFTPHAPETAGTTETLTIDSIEPMSLTTATREAFSQPEESSSGSDGSLWGLLVEAILCGLLMLLSLSACGSGRDWAICS